MIALVLVLLSSSATAADWLQFRGPQGLGLAASTPLPDKFSSTEGVVWKTVVGPGKSSPVLVADKVCLTSALPGKLETLCLQRNDGKVAWRQQIPHTREEARHKLNHPASPSPVSDGQNLYVFFSDFGLISYSLDGKERWRGAARPVLESARHGSLATTCRKQAHPGV